MRLLLSATLLAAALTGCQARPATHAAATAPRAIEALVDQKVVWSCPQCGMDYDAAGKCPMCDVDLVKTAVSYVCPVDDKAVERAGKCPRCDANAKIVKTAVAEAAPEGATESGAPKGTGVSRTPAASGSGSPSGS